VPFAKSLLGEPPITVVSSISRGSDRRHLIRKQIHFESSFCYVRSGLLLCSSYIARCDSDTRPSTPLSTAREREREREREKERARKRERERARDVCRVTGTYPTIQHLTPHLSSLERSCVHSSRVSSDAPIKYIHTCIHIYIYIYTYIYTYTHIYTYIYIHIG
jgi:hypothetical protein